MDVFFYLTHTLYAKALIPLIVKLVDKGAKVGISENKPGFLRYNPHRYAGTPISNTFVNRSSFDYVSRLIDYSKEWDAVREKVEFKFSSNPKRYGAIIGTTKNLGVLRDMRRGSSQARIFAVGYQHMPFILSLRGAMKDRNLPDACTDIFTKTNPFSETHRFSDYISDSEVSFRDFSYMGKVYSDYYLKYLQEGGIAKRHVLIFHPGGYRGVITNIGEGKEASYQKQKDFFITICGPVLEKGLIPVIKAHPLAARYHFKKDILEILHSISRCKKDFSKVVVEDINYYKYVYGSDTIVSFGSSSVYELFAMMAKNVLICNFLGSTRSSKFSFMKGIFVNSVEEYNNFWRGDSMPYFSNAYKENNILNRIYESYSTLFADDTSEQILRDIGLS